MARRTHARLITPYNRMPSRTADASFLPFLHPPPCLHLIFARLPSRPQTPRSTAPAPFPHRLHRSTTPPPPCSSASSTPRARARRRRRRAVRAALRAARSSRRIRAKAQTASIRENNGEREHPSPARGGAGAHHMVHASDVRGGEGGGSAVSSRGTATWSGMDGWVL